MGQLFPENCGGKTIFSAFPSVGWALPGECLAASSKPPQGKDSQAGLPFASPGMGQGRSAGGGCGQCGRCNPAFSTLQGWSLSVEPVSGPRSPDDEEPNNMESGKMAPPKNAPRDALVSAKDERGHMKLRAAGDPGVRPRRRGLQRGSRAVFSPAIVGRTGRWGCPGPQGALPLAPQPYRTKASGPRECQSSRPAWSPGPRVRPPYQLISPRLRAPSCPGS